MRDIGWGTNLESGYHLRPSIVKPEWNTHRFSLIWLQDFGSEEVTIHRIETIFADPRTVNKHADLQN